MSWIHERYLYLWRAMQSRKVFFEFQVSSISALLLLILFMSFVQVQGKYIFRETESISLCLIKRNANRLSKFID